MTGIVEKSEFYGGIVDTRLSRRAALMGLASTALLATQAIWPKSAKAAGSSLTFAELKRVYDQTHHVAPGYDAAVLISWGDPLFADVPAFDPPRSPPTARRKQFGYNCDFIGFMPLPEGSDDSEHGLLCVNNEYISTERHVPGHDRGRRRAAR